jgi:hypothetical protein
MAFAETQLSKIAELKPAIGKSHGRQLWHYESGADNIAAVVTAGYFNGARGIIKADDRIQLVANNAADVRLLKVTAAPEISGNITTAALDGDAA